MKSTFGRDGVLHTGIVWTSALHLLEGERRSDPALLFCAGAVELAPGEFQGIVKAYDLNHYSDECQQTFMGHTGRVRTVTTLNRSGPLCSGGDDGSLRFWDIASAKCVKGVDAAHDGCVQVLRQYGDDSSASIVSVGKDGQVKLWDLRQKRVAMESSQALPRSMQDRGIQSVACRLGSQTIFTGMAASGKAKCHIAEWDVRDGLSFRRVVGSHVDAVLGLEVACDETMLVSMSKDGALAIRDLREDSIAASENEMGAPLLAELCVEKNASEEELSHLPAWMKRDTFGFSTLAMVKQDEDSRGTGLDETVFTVSTDIKLRSWDLSRAPLVKPQPHSAGTEVVRDETVDETINRCFESVQQLHLAEAKDSASTNSGAGVDRPVDDHVAAVEDKAGCKGSSPTHSEASTDAPKGSATQEAGESVPSWLLKNPHYQRLMRLKPGDLVVLSQQGEEQNGDGCIKAGQVGMLLSDDHSNTPYEVEGPDSAVTWFEQQHLVAAPKGSEFLKSKAAKETKKTYQPRAIVEDQEALAFYNQGFRGGNDAPREAEAPAKADDDADDYLPVSMPLDKAPRRTNAEEMERMKRIDESMEMMKQQRRRERGGSDGAGGGGGWRSRYGR